MSENLSGIARSVSKHVQTKLLQKATDAANNAVEKQQQDTNEPLAQVPAETLRANMMPNTKNKSAKNISPAVKERLDKIKEMTGNLDDEPVCNPGEYEKIVKLFHDAIDSAQNSQDFIRIVNTFKKYSENIVSEFSGEVFKHFDIPTKQVALMERLYDKSPDIEWNSKSSPRDYLYSCFECEILKCKDSYIDPNAMNGAEKAKYLLVSAKKEILLLKANPAIGKRGSEETVISRILNNLDTLKAMNDSDVPALIEECFGTGETIDSVKEKAFISLASAKIIDAIDVGSVELLLKNSSLKEYLKEQTIDKQKELLSYFYPLGNGENEKEIRNELDATLEGLNLPKPDLGDKHYDEQHQLDGLNSENKIQKDIALRALGNIYKGTGDIPEEFKEHFNACLQDDYGYIRQTALRALGFIYKGKGNIPEEFKDNFNARLQDDYEFIKPTALIALGNIYKGTGDIPKEFKDNFNACLQVPNKDDSVTASALSVLGNIYKGTGDIPEEFKDNFNACLQDDYEFIKQTALRALGNIYKGTGDIPG